MEQSFFFTDYRNVVLFIFAVALVFAGRTVFKLRSTSATYTAKLLPFAYFSLCSWILGALQYVILVAGPFIESSRNIGLFLGVMQIALWISAVLSLSLEPFSQMWVTVPLLLIVSIFIVLITFRTTLLTSDEFIIVEAVSSATIFTAFAVSILRLRLNKLYAAAFFIHGYSQWIWRYLWLAPSAGTPIVLFAFPFWRIALMIIWIRLISEMQHRAQPLSQKVRREVERPELPNLPVTLRVMISSTVEDLAEERDAADRAILGLYLTRFRAEKFGSVPYPPRVICALLAEHCDIFVLITGERYGYVIESDGMSVVEFEYEVARAHNREKILVYVKDGVTREPRLEEFVRRLQDFEEGYFRSLFTTPEDLYEKVQRDIQRLLSWKTQQKPKAE